MKASPGYSNVMGAGATPARKAAALYAVRQLWNAQGDDERSEKPELDAIDGKGRLSRRICVDAAQSATQSDLPAVAADPPHGIEAGGSRAGDRLWPWLFQPRRCACAGAG